VVIGSSIILRGLKTHLYFAPSHPASALINIESAAQIINSRVLSQFGHLASSDSARQLKARDIGLIGLKKFLYVANVE
jgi:hypothetical protein